MQTALALAVLTYAENIDNPEALTGPLSRIGHKHRSLDIRPEQYAIVGGHLLSAIREVLGQAATPPLLEAWGVAYGELAGLMRNIEAGLYADTVAREEGWSGWRPFVVKKKVQETAEITSFYLYPADGGKVASFVPGQYISVQVYLPELGLRQPRQYSLSDAPNGRYYRISVKRENGLHPSPDGMISNHLHDNIQAGDAIQLTAPVGDFVLDRSKQTPVVFISGGVGQTPFISMCEYLINTDRKREVVWIHGSRNPPGAPAGGAARKFVHRDRRAYPHGHHPRAADVLLLPLSFPERRPLPLPVARRGTPPRATAAGLYRTPGKGSGIIAILLLP